MKIKEKIRSSYFLSFVIQASLMFVLNLLFSLMMKYKIDYLQNTLTSIVYGIIMSWFFINAMKKNNKKNSE